MEPKTLEIFEDFARTFHVFCCVFIFHVSHLCFFFFLSVIFSFCHFSFFLFCFFPLFFWDGKKTEKCREIPIVKKTIFLSESQCLGLGGQGGVGMANLRGDPAFMFSYFFFPCFPLFLTFFFV